MTLSKISGIFVFLSEIKFILNDSVAFFVGLIILHQLYNLVLDEKHQLFLKQNRFRFPMISIKFEQAWIIFYKRKKFKNKNFLNQ